MSGKNGKSGKSLACIPVQSFSFDNLGFIHQLIEQTPGAIKSEIAREVYDLCATEIKKMLESKKNNKKEK